MANGLIKYCTGKACKRGHFSDRYVKTGECVSCKALADSEYAKANAARLATKLSAWKLKNPDAYRKYAATYYERHKQRCHEAATKWAKNNPEKVKAAVLLNKEGCRLAAKKYRSANPHIGVASENRRRARLLNASVVWADHDKINRIYEDAAKSGMHVDHIFPLRGKTVCGLHVETNLRLMDPVANFAKGNKLPSEFA